MPRAAEALAALLCHRLADDYQPSPREGFQVISCCRATAVRPVRDSLVTEIAYTSHIRDKLIAASQEEWSRAGLCATEWSWIAAATLLGEAERRMTTIG